MYDFQPISRRISETMRDTAKVAILITNRKSHMSFQLVPQSTTLDGLEPHSTAQMMRLSELTVEMWKRR